MHTTTNLPIKGSYFKVNTEKKIEKSIFFLLSFSSTVVSVGSLSLPLLKVAKRFHVFNVLTNLRIKITLQAWFESP